MDATRIAERLVTARGVVSTRSRTRISLDVVLEFDDEVRTQDDVTYEAQMAFLDGLPETYRSGRLKVTLVGAEIVAGLVDKNGVPVGRRS